MSTSSREYNAVSSARRRLSSRKGSGGRVVLSITRRGREKGIVIQNRPASHSESSWPIPTGYTRESECRDHDNSSDSESKIQDEEMATREVAVSVSVNSMSGNEDCMTGPQPRQKLSCQNEEVGPEQRHGIDMRKKLSCQNEEVGPEQGHGIDMRKKLSCQNEGVGPKHGHGINMKTTRNSTPNSTPCPMSEKTRAVVRERWRFAIKKVIISQRCVRQFEEPVARRRKLNMSKVLSQKRLEVDPKASKKQKRSTKQKQEEIILRTVVKRFRLRRKDSYTRDAQNSNLTGLRRSKSVSVLPRRSKSAPFGEKGGKGFKVAKSNVLDTQLESPSEPSDDSSSEDEDIEELGDGEKAILPTGFGRGIQFAMSQRRKASSGMEITSTCETMKRSSTGDSGGGDGGAGSGVATHGTATAGLMGGVAGIPNGGVAGMVFGMQRMSKRAEFKLADEAFVLHPSSPFKQGWDVAMFVLISYLMISIPYSVAFVDPTPEGEPLTAFEIWDKIVDGIFWFDIFLSFNTAFYTPEQVLIVSRKKIIFNYLKLWFWIDLLAALPLDSIFTSMIIGNKTEGQDNIGSGNKAIKLVRGVRLLRQIRMLKLLRLMRLARLLRKQGKSGQSFSTSRYKYVIKMAKMVGFVIFLAHFLACMWYSLASQDDPGAAFLTWESVQDPNMSVYLRALYHTVAMLISDQGGVEPRSHTDYIFCTVCMLAGAIVISIVFGQMALIISDMGAQRSNFRRKMERVHTSMKFLGLPPLLQKRVFRYYTYLWEQHRSVDGKLGGFVEELSANLASEVTIYMRHKVISNNLIFSECYAEELHDIVLALKRSFYMPSDYVVRQGAIGQGLYLLHSGELDILQNRETRSIAIGQDGKPLEEDEDDDDEEMPRRTVRLGILGPGAHFGSTNLWVPKPELASVVARTNSEVLILERKAFARLCAKHKGLTQRVLYDAHSEAVASPAKEAESFPPKPNVPLSELGHRGRGKHSNRTSSGG